MELKTIILKSGFRFSVDSSNEITSVARTEITVKGERFNEEWVEKIYKVENGFLKIEKGETFWEIRESEIAAYEFVNKEEVNI